MASPVIATKLSADSTIFSEKIFRSFGQVRMGNESPKLKIQSQYSTHLKDRESNSHTLPVPPIIAIIDISTRHQLKQCSILIAFEGGENGLSVVNASRQSSCMLRPRNQNGNNVDIRSKFAPCYYIIGGSNSETKGTTHILHRRDRTFTTNVLQSCSSM